MLEKCLSIPTAEAVDHVRILYRVSISIKQLTAVVGRQLAPEGAPKFAAVTLVFAARFRGNVLWINSGDVANVKR
jgi:hypothetical protein